MGFFSWNCAVSGESVANICSSKPPEQCSCYLVTPFKTYFEPAYEGYGVFGGADVFELLGLGDRIKGVHDNHTGKGIFKIKVVLAKYFNGQSYDELPESEDCKYQGYFYP